MLNEFKYGVTSYFEYIKDAKAGEVYIFNTKDIILDVFFQKPRIFFYLKFRIFKNPGIQILKSRIIFQKKNSVKSWF